jgi:hypothetical protein
MKYYTSEILKELKINSWLFLLVCNICSYIVSVAFPFGARIKVIPGLN